MSSHNPDPKFNLQLAEEICDTRRPSYTDLKHATEILQEGLRAIADEEHCSTEHTVSGLRAIARQILAHMPKELKS